MESIKGAIYDLIVETSTNLPPDVRYAIQKATEKKTKELVRR